MDDRSTPILVGRDEELSRLDALLARGAAGESATLAVTGQPGIGKTALLDAAAAAAARSGATVLRTRGYEGEADLPYAALFALVRPLLGLRDQLPPIQSRALGVALALDEPAPVDRFAVPAATLALLSLAGPVVAVVDDLHWVDDASRAALLFAARRLHGEGVVVLLGAREDELPADELAGVERLEVGGLDRDAAIALLRDLPPAVAATLAERTAGNPLALLELPAQLTAAQRSGGEPLDGPLPVAGTLDEAFGRRIEALAPETRRALVVAALLDGPTPATLEAALAELGLPPDTLTPATAAGLLVTAGDEVTFAHPLMRSSAYQRALAVERREAHAAIAAVIGDDRRRVWHRALATLRPDAQVADDLAGVGADALERGAHGAAARAWERAAELTPDEAEADRRRLAAATAWLDAGHADRTIALLEALRRERRTGPPPSEVTMLRARTEMRRGRPTVAHAALVAEAERLRDEAPAAAAQAMLEAAVAHMMTGDVHALVADAAAARDLARGVAEAAPVEAMAEVLLGETYLAMGRSAEGDALLAAREPFLLDIDPLAVPVEIYGMVGHSSAWIERWDRADAILDRLVGSAREASAFGKLVYPLAARAQVDFRQGRWVRALADADEAVQLARATGQVPLLPHALSVLAEIEAGLGRTADAQAHGREGLDIAASLGLQALTAYLLRATGLDHLGQGRIEPAIEALGRATAIAEDLQLGTAGLVMFMPDHVEALVRAGRDAEAVDVLAAFRRRVDSGGSWAPAAAARCAGMLAPDGEYEQHFERALAHHAEGRQPFEEARTLLAFGERLRRSRRRGEARAPVAAALERFTELGAAPWAARAEQELAASGAADRAPVPASVTELLTPAELQVALMVARGLRNREVAAGLYLSERTVENHLSAIYRKLDIRSRARLAARVAAAP